MDFVVTRMDAVPSSRARGTMTSLIAARMQHRVAIFRTARPQPRIALSRAHSRLSSVRGARTTVLPPPAFQYHIHMMRNTVRRFVRRPRSAESDDVGVAADQSVENATVIPPGADASTYIPVTKETSTPSMSHDSEAVEEMSRVLRATLSPRAAAIIARGFVDLGIKTPNDLRKTVLKRSMGLIAVEVFATLFNALMTVSMFVLSVNLNYNPYEAVFPTFMAYVAFAMILIAGAIFAVETAAHFILLSAYLYSLVTFETADLKKFMSATQQLGDTEHIIGALTPASMRRATSSMKVVSLLNQIRDALHEEAELITPHYSTLHNLAAYFEYANAKEKFGFVPSNYGISEQEAMRIASLFSEHDKDGTGELDGDKLKVLLSSMGHDVTDMDCNIALRMLDKEEDGVVSLNDFVEWYVKGISVPAYVIEQKQPAIEKQKPQALNKPVVESATPSDIEDAAPIDPGASFDEDA